jgi:hypothetical protein
MRAVPQRHHVRANIAAGTPGRMPVTTSERSDR